MEEGLLRSSKQTKELHQTAPALHPLDSNQLELALPKTDLKEPKSKEEANQQVQPVPSQKTYTLKFRYVVRDNPNLVLYQPYEMTVREDQLDQFNKVLKLEKIPGYTSPLSSITIDKEIYLRPSKSSH